MISLVGLFNRTPKDPAFKENEKKFKEFKKLLKEKKYTEALKSGVEYTRKVPNHHDALVHETNVVTVPKEIADKARLAIDRMLAIS